MNVNDNLKELLSRQKELTKEYDKLAAHISQDDLINENAKLKEKLNALEQSTKELRRKYKALEDNNTNLKTSLHNQFVSERAKIITSSKNKELIYFGKAVEPYRNKLHQFEVQINKSINSLTNIINNKIDTEQSKYLTELDDIRNRVKVSVEKIENDLESTTANFREHLNSKYRKLEDDKLSQEMIKQKEKSNNIELKIGLNVINKVAIFVLIIGVITAVQYTYVNWFNDYAKGISVYVLGIMFLVLGGIFHKKGKDVFSLGLLGGGVGILYIATYVCYFILNIINVYLSLIFSVGITAIAIVLSQRYQSKTICALSLVGGYAPVFAYYFSFGISGQAAYIAMIYLLLLNIVVLFLSFKNKWLFVKILSFALNLPAMVLLTNNLNNDTISIIYVLVVFLTYIVITLINPLLNRRGLIVWEIFLLGANTFVKSIFLYNLFNEDYRGLIALIFAVVYLALAKLIKWKAKDERRTRGLFYITALTFALLMIPFQFGIMWTSLGWLIESVLLIYLGRKIVDKNVTLSGWIILGLSFVIFVFNDLLFELWNFIGNNYSGNEYFMFNIKYAVNIIGLVITLALYLPDLKESIIFRKSTQGQMLSLYKYFTLSHVWVFMLYIIWYVYNRTVFNNVLTNNMFTFYRLASYGLITLAYGFAISKIKLLKYGGIKVYISILYFIGFLYGLSINGIILAKNYTYGYQQIIGLVILMVFNVLVYFSVADTLKNMLEAGKLKIQWIPLILGIYSLGISVNFVVRQFDFSYINLFVSIFIVLLSLIYILIGFKRRYIYLRRFGLGLAIAALAKLFIFDLSHLELLGRIIAYFSYGLILLGISFVYQKIKNLVDNDDQEY